jgi:hypothetical protein
LVAEVYDFAREGASLSAILTSSAKDRARIFRITWPRWTITVASLIPETPPPVWTVALGPALYSPKKPNLNCRRTPPARVEETTACCASMRS